MRIVTIHELENCLDRTVVKEFRVEPPLDQATIRRLAEGGRLQYFPHFPRPYFRIDRERWWMIQGIQGNRTFRVTFLSASPGEAEGQLCDLVEGRDRKDSGPREGLDSRQ